MKDWTVAHLPSLNEDVYRRGLPIPAMAAILNERLLYKAPGPEALPRLQAMQLLMILGVVGSSVERHAQQATRRTRDDSAIVPGGGLAQLFVRGNERFVSFFQRTADALEHPHRDTFITYVEHNGPTVETLHPEHGHVIHRLSGAFPDGGYLLFSGEPDEVAFIKLLKKSACLQAAANAYLEQLGEADLLDEPASIQAALWASTLMFAVRALIVDFIRNAPFREDFFLDTLRQYAIPWYPDRPLRAPSGANDDSALLRDVLLFRELLPSTAGFPGFRAYVRAVSSILLPSAARRILGAMDAPPIDTRIEQRLRMPLKKINDLPSSDVRSLLAHNPWLSPYLELFRSQRDLSRAHYATILKYLVRPKQRRDQTNDAREAETVVTNTHGTTMMHPSGILKQLDEARREHPLARLGARDSLSDLMQRQLASFGYRPAPHAELMQMCRTQD